MENQHFRESYETEYSASFKHPQQNTKLVSIDVKNGMTDQSVILNASSVFSDTNSEFLKEMFIYEKIFHFFLKQLYNHKQLNQSSTETLKDFSIRIRDELKDQIITQNMLESESSQRKQLLDKMKHILEEHKSLCTTSYTTIELFKISS